MTTTIEDTARRVITLDKTATAGPWIRSTHGLNVLSKGGRGVSVSTRHSYAPEYEPLPDAELIAYYRTAAPDLAREVLRLAERVTFLESILDHNVQNWQTRTLVLGGALAATDDERTESSVSDAK